MTGEENDGGPELQRAVEAVEAQIRERVDSGESRRDAAVGVMWDVIRWLARGQDSVPQAVKDAVGAIVDRLMADEGLTREHAEPRATALICGPVFHHPGNPFVWEVVWVIGDGPSSRSGRETGPSLEPLLRAVVAVAGETWPPGDRRLAQLKGDLEEHAQDCDQRLPGGMSSFNREWAKVTVTFAPGTPSWLVG